jgi:hypothetical protein
MSAEIRGRVWQSKKPNRRNRLRPSHTGWSGAVWNYEVTVAGVVVMSDNTGWWDSMYETCERNVAALRIVKAALDIESLPKRWASEGVQP